MAEEVVTSINKSVGLQLGWQVHLHRWEDTAPGFGRPQALINPKVDECDLFVGILWERWGQTSGEYSSGFEEEYERARARRKSHDRPEIWLFFKDIDPERLKDPGDQLKRVIEFRKSQMDMGEVLFKDFHKPEDWKIQFNNWLVGHILRLALPVQAAPQQPAAAVSVPGLPATSEIGSYTQGGDQDAVPQQLKSLATLLGETLQLNVPQFFATHDNPLQEFDVARLYLLSATLMSQRYTRDVFGTHDVNLLYKYREHLEATSIERFELLRTVVGDTGKVKPGWFWFQGTDKEPVQNVLFDLARQDSSADVRARAIDLLAAARIEIPPELWRLLPLHDDSIGVRKSAFNYIAIKGDENTLSFLEKLAQDGDDTLQSEVEDAKLRILIRLTPGKALSEVIAKDEHISTSKRRSLLARISEVEEQTLLKGTNSSWEEIRELCLKELVRRGTLPSVLAEAFTRDSSLAVRAIAFQSLAATGSLPDIRSVRKALTNKDDDQGTKTGLHLSALAALGGRWTEPAPDVDSIIATFYRTQTTEEILKAVHWLSVNGHLAYRALALDRFDSFSNAIRSDLANGFRRIKEESFKRDEKEFGPEFSKKLAASYEDLDEFCTLLFTRAALVGLAKHAQPTDAELVRSYLIHADHPLRDLAVTIISDIGIPEDADILLKIAEEAYGDLKEKAAAGALKLSADPLKVAKELMGSNSSEVVRIAFEWMFNQNAREVKKIFRDLLRDGNEANRVRALYYFSTRLQIAELEGLLDEYIREKDYYYNVVTWLDRLLYAPSPLRDMFARDLEAKARGSI